MAKVHISLVGGQPTPVYQGIVLKQPDRIVLICSAQTKDLAEKIKIQIKNLGFFNVQIESCSVEDTYSIREKLIALFHTISEDDELSMNLSSGVKIWSLLCLELCPSASAHIFCLSQNGKVLTIRGESETNVVSFDMSKQFALLGNPLELCNRFSDYGEEEEKNYQNLSRLYKISKFHKLLEKMQSEYSKDKSHYLSSDQSVNIDDSEDFYIDWHADKLLFAISVGNDDKSYYEISGTHAISMLLNTGWFEYEVASYAAKLYGKENVYTNCVFKSPAGAEKNEVDIIVNTGQKLLFIECKTKIYEITAIDKFASVVKNYGGMGSKAIFITLDEMNDLQKEKCRDNKIESYYMRKKASTGNGFHTIPVSDSDFKQRLDKFLTTTNE